MHHDCLGAETTSPSVRRFSLFPRLPNWLDRIATTNLLLAMVLYFYAGWLADGIKGDPLFGLDIGSREWLLAIALSAGFAGCAAFALYARRRTFLPVRILRATRKVRPHGILVLAVSAVQREWLVACTANELALCSTRTEKTLAVPRGLDAALAAISDHRFPWEQLLRGIAPHAQALSQIHLVLSVGEDGSEANGETCRAFLDHCLNNPAVRITLEKGVDFNSLEQLLNVYRSIIDRHGDDAKELMIDVTGGTKLVSIAGAMVSLQNPQVEFQYVGTHGNHSVSSFNVAAEATTGAA